MVSECLPVGSPSNDFVGAEFMELRHAPLALRVAFDAWVIVVAAALLGLYLHG